MSSFEILLAMPVLQARRNAAPVLHLSSALLTKIQVHLRLGKCGAWLAIAAVVSLFACGHDAAPKSVSAAGNSTANSAASPAAASTGAATMPALPTAQKVAPSEAAPPASQTGGFDGAAAYDFTAKFVAFGPRPP